MNFLQLLQQRDALLRQARLANVAFAYERLGEFGARIAQAGLRGEVQLRTADPENDRLWPTLTAQEGNQSVIDEHFLDEDIVDLADTLTFLSGDMDVTAFGFRLEDLANDFRPALLEELKEAGVIMKDESPSRQDAPREGR